MNRSNTITQYESKVTKKGKKVLYLVLKKKTFADEIINSLQVEVERRFKKFLNDIAGDLNKIKLEDEENGLKYIMLKGMINILNQMLKERMVILSEKDKQIINDILENDEESNEDTKEKKSKGPFSGGNSEKNYPKKNEGNYGHSSGKKDNYPYGNPSPNPYGNPSSNPYGGKNPYGNPSPNPYGGKNPYGNPSPNPYGGKNPYGY